MQDVNVHKMIKERFAKLPPKLQEAITSTEVAENLRELAQKYRLHIDQGQILENETYMVLLGVEQAGKYEENLKKELDVSSDIAKNIANDVAKEIFLSIRNTLKESTTPEPKQVQKSTQQPASVQKNPIETSPQTPSINPPIQQAKTFASINTENKDKLASVVKNERKELKINPAKQYVVDPYREPID